MPEDLSHEEPSVEPPPSPDTWVPRAATEDGRDHRVLTWCALIALAVLVWVALPVAVGILLGMLMAFTLQSLYERLLRSMRRPAAASLTTVGIATAGISASVGGLGYLLVSRGSVLMRQVIEALSPGGPANLPFVRLSNRLHPYGLDADKLTARLRDAASELAARVATAAADILAATTGALLSLFFAMMTMHLMLRNWNRITRRAEQVLPLRPEDTRALLDEFRRVGRVTLLGNVLTGLLQGVLAGIGFAISGVPEPVFFGAATAIASLIPVVGTPLVWLPAGICLIATGHLGRGILELAWSVLVVVGISDYVIRPRLIGGAERAPALLTFVALFGGLEVFGLKGLILGPVLVSLAVSVLQLYARESERSRMHLT